MFEFFRLRSAISGLRDRIETLERANKQLQAEWDDTYDKLRVMTARIVKRAERAERAQEEPALPATNGGAPEQATGRLTDRQRAIQQQILRRRAGG